MSQHHDADLPPEARREAPRTQSGPGEPNFWGSRVGLVAIAFLAIVGALLLAEHRAHVLGLAPYLLILACPLMHIFMHHGHGGHRAHDHGGSSARSKTPRPRE